MSVRDADTHKLAYHPEAVANWKKTGESSPLHVEVGITNRCNHRCKFCTLNWITHGQSSIAKDVFLSALDDMGKMGVKSLYFAGEGEPTLHKDLPSFINRAKELGISSSISSNGSLFTSDLAEGILGKLSWIRFSVDALNPKTYADIHGVKGSEINKVLLNIQKCVEIKRKNNFKVDIGTQLILMPENISEVKDLALHLKDIGVDNFQVKPAHNHPKSSFSSDIYWFTQQGIKEDLERLQTTDFTVVIRMKSMERLLQKRTYKECYGFHFYGLIDARGDVVPCNMFYNNKEFIYGNINTESFKKIWTGEKKEKIIKKITSLNHSMCGEYRCRFDVMNRYLERVKNPEINDEFI